MMRWPHGELDNPCNQTHPDSSYWTDLFAFQWSNDPTVLNYQVGYFIVDTKVMT